MSKETFVHPSGNRESEVDIEEGSELGSGRYGYVREVVVRKGDREHTMALKHFFKGREQAQGALDNYKLAKKAGLKVFTTYRISKEGDSILMTNGNSEETACLEIGWKEDRLEKIGGTPIEEIDNFDELLENLYQEAEKATENGLYFNGDEYFFLVDKETKTEVDFVLGDLDGISTDLMRYKDVKHDNVSEIRTSLIFFLKQYLSPEVKSSYIQKAIEFFDKKNET